MDEADRLCDRVAIVDHGALVALDSPLRLKAAIPSQNTLDVSFSAVPAGWRDRLAGLPGVDSVTEHDQVFRIASHAGPETTTALLAAAADAGVEVRSLAVASTSLDDVFVHFTGHELRDALQEASPLDRVPILRR
jgi:ABC-2 type transport system ATP-binding protein